MSDSSYYTQTGTGGQPQHLQYAEWTQDHKDPETQIQEQNQPHDHTHVPVSHPTPKRVHFDDEPIEERFFEGGQVSDSSIPTSDPHATRLNPEHFDTPNNDKYSTAPSPGGDGKKYNTGLFIVVVVLLIAAGVIIWIVVKKNKQNLGREGVVGPAKEIGGLGGNNRPLPYNPSEDVFGSGVLGDLEYL